MDAKEEALGALFKTDVRFVVPRFQRRYVWTLENWSALWSDVVGAVGRYAQSATPAEPANAAQPATVPEHFLGAVVLQTGSAVGPSTLRIRQVIDGQQRLATTQVLFAAAYDVAVARRVDKRYRIALRKLTHNDDEMSHNDDDVYKLWPTFHDWRPFRLAMGGGGQSSTKDRPALLQAYDYFSRELRSWAAPLNGAALEAALDRLITIFNHGLRVVVLDLHSSDNPQVIFESLNARGMPLQASDLVRNHVFYTAEAHHIDPDRLYDEHWARFEDGYWRDDIGTGPRPRTRLDAFLSHFLTMELRREIHSQHVFLDFRRYLDPQGRRLSQVLARLAAYGDIYRALDQRTELDPVERRFMSRLEALDTAAVMPLVLQAFGEYEAEVRHGILSTLESYLVRRVIVGWDAKSYGATVIRLLQRLVGAADPVAIVREQLAGYRGKSAGWPTNADLIRQVRNRSLANVDTKRIRLLLSLIDSHLRTPMSEPIAYEIDALTVEHLMPKSWEEHWPLGAGTADERRELVHTLGNLTLVSEHLNGSMGNAPWENKRVAIAAHSRLQLNHDLPAVWDEDAIRARAAEFGRLLIRALPRPDSSGPQVAPTDEAEPAVADPPDTEGVQTLADDVADDVEDDLEAAPVPPVGRPEPPGDAVARHVLDVLGRRPQGTVMTPAQISRARSSVPRDSRPGARTVTDRLRTGTLTGVETTTNEHGHLAARLAARRGPAERLPEATTILRAPADGTDESARQASLHFAMVQLYSRARDEAGYSASAFLQQLRQRGGIEVARHVLASSGVTAGFRRLHELGRLDLTVEALVLRDEFASLFSADELAMARERLAQHGGEPPRVPSS
jgi:hypothetical protein